MASKKYIKFCVRDHGKKSHIIFTEAHTLQLTDSPFYGKKIQPTYPAKQSVYECNTSKKTTEFLRGSIKNYKLITFMHVFQRNQQVFYCAQKSLTI